MLARALSEKVVSEKLKRDCPPALRMRLLAMLGAAGPRRQRAARAARGQRAAGGPKQAEQKQKTEASPNHLTLMSLVCWVEFEHVYCRSVGASRGGESSSRFRGGVSGVRCHPAAPRRCVDVFRARACFCFFFFSRSARVLKEPKPFFWWAGSGWAQFCPGPGSRAKARPPRSRSCTGLTSSG